MSLAQGRAASAVRRVWRQEQSEIAQVAARLALVAGGMGNLTAELGGGAARGLLEVLEHTILPYLDWEETIVHPVIDRLTGAPRASRVLRVQVDQVRALIGIVQADWERIGRTPTRRQVIELQAHLRGLTEVLRIYLVQQERVLAPALAPSAA